MLIVTQYRLFLITVFSGKPAASTCRVKVTKTEQNFDPEDGGNRTLQRDVTNLPGYTVSWPTIPWRCQMSRNSAVYLVHTGTFMWIFSSCHEFHRVSVFIGYPVPCYAYCPSYDMALYSCSVWRRRPVEMGVSWKYNKPLPTAEIGWSCRLEAGTEANTTSP